jgi:hypothetical protein
MFGHPVTLNFNRQGDTYFTTFGGVISILLNALLFWYVSIIFGKMIARKGDSINLVTERSNFTDIGEITLQDAEFMPMLVIRDPDTFLNNFFPEFIYTI